MRGTALLITLAAIPAIGAAEPPPSAGELTAARGHFQAGQVYYEQGDYRRALIEFREAAADADRPELDYNLAMTYERLGDAARARRSYQRFLERAPTTADRVVVEARIAELDPKIGSLVIVSKVGGATFRLDDEPVQPEALGQPIFVTAGHHRLVASKDGYSSRAIEVELVGRFTTRVALDPTRSGRAKIAIAVAVSVVAATAVVLGAVLGAKYLGPTAEPVKGTFPPGVETVP